MMTTFAIYVAIVVSASTLVEGAREKQDLSSCLNRCGEHVETTPSSEQYYEYGYNDGYYDYYDEEVCSCGDECVASGNCCWDYEELCVVGSGSGYMDENSKAPTQVPVEPPRINCSTHAVGDPHYRTCDGYYYDFQGECDYIFAMDCRTVGATSLQIQTRNSNPLYPGYPVTMTEGVAIRMPNNDVIEFSSYGGTHRHNGVVTEWNETRQFYDVNGSHPYSIVSRGSYRTIVRIPSLGARIIWSYWYNLYFDLMSNSPLQGNLCGLVGDGDGDQSNDASLVAMSDNWRVQSDLLFFETDPRDPASCFGVQRRHARASAPPPEKDQAYYANLLVTSRKQLANRPASSRPMNNKRSRRSSPGCNCGRDAEAAEFCSDLAPGGIYEELCEDQWDVAYFNNCKCDFCYDADAAIAIIESMQHSCLVGNESDIEDDADPASNSTNATGVFANITFPPLPTNGFQLAFGNSASFCGDGSGSRASGGINLGNDTFTVGQCIAAATLAKAYVAVEYVPGERCTAYEICEEAWACNASCTSAEQSSGRTYIVPTWAPTPSPTSYPTSPHPTAAPIITQSPTSAPTSAMIKTKIENAITVVKYSTNGTIIFRVDVGDETTTVRSAKVDDNGYVFATGVTNGGVGLAEIGGEFDGFIVKLDAQDGSVMWVRQLGTGGSDSCADVAFSVNNTIVVSGTTDGVFAGNSAKGDSDGFVAKFADDGTLMWVTQFGTSDADASGMVASDSSGQVVVYAYTQTNGEDWDLLFTSLDATGTVQLMSPYLLYNELN